MALVREPLRFPAGLKLARDGDSRDGMLLHEKELPDRIAIGEHHQHRDDGVPESEPVERRWYPQGRIDGNRITHGHCLPSQTEMRADKNGNEENCRTQK